MRKVLIPIHIKLISFFILILGLSVSFYVYYAVGLFKEDKTAYVFESVKIQNDSVTSILEEKIENAFAQLKTKSQLSYSSSAIKSVFDHNINLLAYGEYNRDKWEKSIQDRSLDDGTKKFWEEIRQKFESYLDQGTKGARFLHGERNYILFWMKLGSKTLASLYDVQYFLSKMEKNKLFSYLLIDSHKMLNLTEESFKAVDVELLIKKSDSLNVTEGSFTHLIENSRWIISYKKLVDGIVLLTLVPEEKAYQASWELQRKSIYFAGLVMAVTILLVMFFSKIFTVPIGKLFEASQKFAKQDFEHQVVLGNKDELGVLADSFNYMSGSIVKFIGEMKEKNRLENEMLTAQMVQKSFIPDDEFLTDNLHLKAFYRPATECGGDWWGKLEIDNRLILIMIDATGHGTGAALITAVIHNSLTALEFIIKKDKNYLESSAEVMNFLNDSICNVNSDMLATAFVAIFDKNSKRMIYTNASHNPPLLIKSSKPKIDKSDLIPLMENNGKRLGERKGEFYTETALDLEDRDKIIFYTDGLVEGESVEGKAWGKRKMLKILVEQGHANINELVDKTITDAFKFYGDMPQADDITFVGIEIGKHTGSGGGKMKNDIVSYEGTFDQMIAGWQRGDLANHIVHQSKITDQKNTIFPDPLSEEPLLHKEFLGESVSEVTEVIKNMLKDLELEDHFSDISRYILLNSIELVQNALIQTREAGKSTPVYFAIYQSDVGVQIYVEDKVGKLDKEKIMEKLQRAYREKTFEEKDSGAGLGLYMVVNNCDILSFDVKDNEYTRVNCFLNRYQRLKEFKNKKISIHFKTEA